MKPETLEACLLGGALGDSLGLPSEGINARRIAELRPRALRQCLIGGKGMVSDDTEHAVMTLLSLRESGNDPEVFARKLAARLRGWLASVPAGIGLATAKSILKLSIGVRPERSGVWSAGNGPLMRAPIIGVWHAGDEELRNRFIEASTLMTHRDPRALEAARIIGNSAAIATLRGSDATAGEILAELEKDIESNEFKARFTLLRQGLAAGDGCGTFANRFSRKAGYVTGFAPDSAAVAIYAWLRHRGDFRATIESVVRAGGDTDTIAFIAGSIAGIECGREHLPADWLKGLYDWPVNRTLIAKISSGQTVRYPGWPMTIPRNFVFLLIVLCHGFRRLLPPY
jgi:ADP-ribosylglycohydrolase